MNVKKLVVSLSMLATLALALPVHADHGDRRDGYRGQYKHQLHKGMHVRHGRKGISHRRARAHKHWHKHRARHGARYHLPRSVYRAVPPVHHYRHGPHYRPNTGHHYYNGCRANGASFSLWLDGLGISYAEPSRC